MNTGEFLLEAAKTENCPENARLLSVHAPQTAISRELTKQPRSSILMNVTISP
jgi:hypothetical protein